MRRFGFGLLALVTILAVSAEAALARCAQRDLTGDWQFYNSFVDIIDFGVVAGWSSCLISVDSDGVVVSGGVCVDFDKATTTIVGGDLTVTADCVVTGSVTVEDSVTMDMGTALIEHATMDDRANVIHGVGRDEGSVAGFSLHMVKK